MIAPTIIFLIAVQAKFRNKACVYLLRVGGFVVLFFTTVLSQWDFSHGKLRVPSLRKATCNRVALPNLGHMLGVLVFP